MSRQRVAQKFIAFTNSNSPELEEVKRDLKSGWGIVNLVQNGNYYCGIMEKFDDTRDSDSFLLLPKKKLKITAKNTQNAF